MGVLRFDSEAAVFIPLNQWISRCSFKALTTTQKRRASGQVNNDPLKHCCDLLFSTLITAGGKIDETVVTKESGEAGQQAVVRRRQSWDKLNTVLKGVFVQKSCELLCFQSHVLLDYYIKCPCGPFSPFTSVTLKRIYLTI